jgi:hypothetical protein
MSVTFAYPAAGLDPAQLHDELLAAGLAPERVERWPDIPREPEPEPEPPPPPRPGPPLGPPPPPPPPPEPPPPAVPTVVLTFPDGQAQGPVDAVVVAHVPRARYDPATRQREVGALLRESGRASLRARVLRATTLDDIRDALLTHLREEEEDEAG